MERLCAAAVELQAALEAAPMKAGYNMHVETLAIAAKTATNLARQVGPLFARNLVRSLWCEKRLQAQQTRSATVLANFHACQVKKLIVAMVLSR